MADMERVDDFILNTGELDHNDVDTLYWTAPRSVRLVKAYACQAGAMSGGASTITITSAKGALTDTLVIASGGTAGDVTALDVREEANNSFAKGTKIQVARDGGPTGASPASLTLVFRPL
jgi:hypothetical protein